MKYIFNQNYIMGHKVLFYIYLAIMILIILLTIIFIVKEISKKE